MEARRSAPSVLYWPNIDVWWSTASETLRSTIALLISDIPETNPVLLLATSNISSTTLMQDESLATIFHPRFAKLYELKYPTRQMRLELLNPIRYAILEPPASAPSIAQTESILPTQVPSTISQAVETQAPLSAPSHIDVTNRKDDAIPVNTSVQLEDPDARVLRQVRSFLRSVLELLMKSFDTFTDPIDFEKMPDYLEVVPKPICLLDMLSKINDGSYLEPSQFLADIDLLVTNTRSYWNDNNSGARMLVNSVCQLQDTALAYVTTIDRTLLLQSTAIAKKRAAQRLVKKSRSLNSRIYKPPYDDSTTALMSENSPVGEDVDGTIIIEDDLSTTMIVDSQIENGIAQKSSTTGNPPQQLISTTPENPPVPTTASNSDNPIPESNNTIASIPQSQQEFVIDLGKVEQLFSRLVDCPDQQFTVDQLELINFHLHRIYYQHEMDWDRTLMLRKLEDLISEWL
jgi:hypothetical protein